MGQLSTTPASRRRRPQPWPRSGHRRWMRPNDVASVTRLFTAIPSLPRAELSRLVTRMIDRMDEIDGDPDLEAEEDVDEAHDDGCDPVYVRGQLRWGATDDAEGRHHIPVYGIDQSAGPLRNSQGGYRWREQETTRE